MLTVLNDLHIGSARSAGTTPASQKALRLYSHSSFNALLPTSGDLMILGDLFDGANVPIMDVLQVYVALDTWLTQHPENWVYNVAGNHDVSKSSDVMSSFEFLGKLLMRRHTVRYVHITEPQMTRYGYVVPHLRNQELFDAALAEVPECNKLFLHCNIDNNFAAQSDHSLNMTKQQIADCPADTIICGHEHQARTVGKVLLPGNQIATSVSDWLGSGDKKFLVFDDEIAFRTCAIRSEEFVEMPWNALEVTNHRFVRVVGEAQPDDIGSVLTAINKFRQVHPAFVITNAVTTVTDAVDNAAIFAQSLESVQRFSIEEALRRVLTAEEFAVLEAL